MHLEIAQREREAVVDADQSRNAPIMLKALPGKTDRAVHRAAILFSFAAFEEAVIIPEIQPLCLSSRAGFFPQPRRCGFQANSTPRRLPHNPVPPLKALTGACSRAKSPALRWAFLCRA